MNRTRTRVGEKTRGAPEDLLIFRARMDEYGVRVRLPTTSAGYQLPEPIKVQGEPLGDTVIHLRDRTV
ncbi:MAG: hypothetical protein JO306_04120 [Gemmatimonadetes bacterium]|nr:hypothetical protein [Gemmatimonadota bacterium]